VINGDHAGREILLQLELEEAEEERTTASEGGSTADGGGRERERERVAAIVNWKLGNHGARAIFAAQVRLGADGTRRH
jgi:hypothetical protein